MSEFTAKTIDRSRWRTGKYHHAGTPSTPDEVSIFYIDCPPPSKPKGTLLLIHGFPQTSYQFRYMITPLSDAGYRVIVPDYRGAGLSSRPRDARGFHKSVMAADLHGLVTRHLGITQPIHVIGHDIGGMIAHAYASRYPGDTASVAWGECPLPGTEVYEKAKLDPGVFHFHFHWQSDLPEALVAGREAIYFKHFFNRLTYRTAGISAEDVEHYALMYQQPGGLRCGFDVYRGFHADAVENKEWLQEHGKSKVPVCALNGAKSFLCQIAQDQVSEVYETVTEVRTVEESGHYISEENPDGYVKDILAFVDKH